MKTKLIISVACLFFMTGLAFGVNLLPISPQGGVSTQPGPILDATTQSINLYTHGSTSQTSTTVAVGGTFSLDTYITFTGFTSMGLSYWLEAENSPSNLAAHLTLVSETYGQN